MDRVLNDLREKNPIDLIFDTLSLFLAKNHKQRIEMNIHSHFCMFLGRNE